MNIEGQKILSKRAITIITQILINQWKLMISFKKPKIVEVAIE